MEILLLIVGLVIGYLIGEFYCLYRMRHIIMDAAAKEGIDIEAELDKMEKAKNNLPEVHKLRIQTIDDILYLYTDREDFICQAKSVEELASLSQQYKNIKYAAVIHNDKVFTFVNGVATEKQ
jgi:hypothetical protein